MLSPQQLGLFQPRKFPRQHVSFLAENVPLIDFLGQTVASSEGRCSTRLRLSDRLSWFQEQEADLIKFFLLLVVGIKNEGIDW